MSRTVTLDEVAEINPTLDGAVRAQDRARDVPFLPMAAVSENGTVDYAEQRKLGSVLKGYTAFARGDVLLAKITPCFENGKAAHLQDLPSDVGFGSTEFHVMRPGPELDGRYLFHFIRSPHFREDGERNMSGTAGQKRIPTGFLQSYKLVLPPLAEQRRIAALLDRADEVRRKREESRRLVDELLRSVFLEMFGDPVRNEKGWEVVQLREKAYRVQIGPFGSLLHDSDYIDGGVPLINPMHIRDGRIAVDSHRSVTQQKAESLHSYRVEPGEVILGRRGEMGRCAIVLPEHAGFLCGTGSIVIRPKSEVLRPEYLQMVLSSAAIRTYLEGQTQGATMPNLNRAIVADLPVALPAVKEQLRFVALRERLLMSGDRHDVFVHELTRLSGGVEALCWGSKT